MVGKSNYHMAYAARAHCRFLRPERQGRFEAMLRDLGERPLGEVTRAVAAGRVRCNGQPYAWEAEDSTGSSLTLPRLSKPPAKRPHAAGSRSTHAVSALLIPEQRRAELEHGDLSAGPATPPRSSRTTNQSVSVLPDAPLRALNAVVERTPSLAWYSKMPSVE